MSNGDISVTITITPSGISQPATIRLSSYGGTYHHGDPWPITATITDPAANDTPVNPGSVTITIQSPSGEETTPELTDVDTGVYQTTVELTEPGRWTAIIEATGNYKAIRPATIEAHPLPFDPYD